MGAIGQVAVIRSMMASVGGWGERGLADLGKPRQVLALALLNGEDGELGGQRQLTGIQQPLPLAAVEEHPVSNLLPIVRAVRAVFVPRLRGGGASERVSVGV
jgi:hypothetical protein